jgi:hypothetical protein
MNAQLPDDLRHYTRTMAAVMAGQGHWEKAAEIYRHLLAREPERAAELRELLQNAERQAAAARDAGGLAPLFDRWLELLLAAGNIARLERLRAALGGAPAASPPRGPAVNS